MKKLIQMDFNNDLMQVGVFSEEEASLLSGTVQNHTTQIQNLTNSANTINNNIVIIENEIDGLEDGLSALSADVQEIIEEDYVTEEELDARGYLTESAASETYQPITQFRTINSSAITGDNSNLEIYYDDTQVKADIQKLSGDIQTIVGGDFVTQDDLSAYTTIEYAENTYLKEVPTAITNEIQTISAQVQTISGSYLTQDDLNGYATTAFTEATYLKEVPTAITNEIQTISAQVQTISGSYLTQDDLNGYATTAFTESTYLKEVPQSVIEDIHVISGQVETLGNTVVINSQNIQSISGNVNTISGQVQTISGNVNTISGDVETLKNTPFVKEGDNISVLINDAGYLLPSSLKTINKMSLIGNGDITIGTGETYDDTEIQQKVSTVSGQVQTVSGQVQTVSGNVNTVSGQVQSLSGQVIALSGSLDNYLTEAEAAQTYQLKTQFRTINGNAITGDNTNIVIESGSEYSGGSNIDITNNVISVTGITVPTKVSELTNDAGYLTKASGDTIYATQVDLISVSGDIPTKTSDLTNDSGFLTSSDFKTINNASIVGSGNIVVPTIWIGTQAQYDALPSYDNNTIYCIEKES